MSDLKANIHPNRFRLGLCPRPHWRSTLVGSPPLGEFYFLTCKHTNKPVDWLITYLAWYHLERHWTDWHGTLPGVMSEPAQTTSKSPDWGRHGEKGPSSSSLLWGGLRPALRPSINCGPMRNPDYNQRLGKSISRSYELERMHNLHRVTS